MFGAGHLLATYGVLGIGAILFAETGLLVGLLLPGETVAILGGAYSHVHHAGQPHPQLAMVILVAAAGAALGGQLGYLIGRRAGQALLDRPDGRLYRREQLERTHAYFEHYGAQTIVIARFLPFVRTLSSPAAGVAEMPVRRFTAYNVGGALLWATVVASLGYMLGGVLDVDHHALLITLGIVAVSVTPGVIELHRHRRRAVLSRP
jgi:membrane-associated protein